MLGSRLALRGLLRSDVHYPCVIDAAVPNCAACEAGFFGTSLRLGEHSNHLEIHPAARHMRAPEGLKSCASAHCSVQS